MRGLLALVIGMGVLIVAGVATIGITILHRMNAVPLVRSTRTEFVLDQPAGTRIVGAAGFGDRLVVTLQGGGPDRVVIVDQDGSSVGGVRLSR